ncbi:MAG: LemA family protein [Peptostreptococcaceae bacterium]|nr:LemA family protein [Peptostreptococcaceae bacterium]
MPYGMMIVSVLIVAVLLYAVSMQRRLVHLDELVSNALSQIGVQQNSRWDALTALAELTKGYADHEARTLTEVIGRRLPAGTKVSQVNQQEGLLTEALGRIMAIAESYPQLRASENYREAMESVNLYEEQVRMSRMVYNDSVTKMNRLVRAFPGSIFAGILGFGQREYLEELAGKTRPPSMKF